MAGFFEDIGEFFTGNKKRAAEKKQSEQQAQAQAQADADRERQLQSRAGVNAATQGLYDINRDVAGVERKNAAQSDAAGGRADAYGRQVSDDMGTGAADYMRRANEASTGQADALANRAGKSAIRQKLMAARSAGLNKGAAALAGGRGASDLYNQQFSQQLQRGQDMYGQNVQQRAQLGQVERQNQQGFTGMQMQGQNQRAQNTQAAGNFQQGLYGQDMGSSQFGHGNAIGITQQQMGGAAADAGAGGSALGGFISGVGSLLSDKNAKTDIAPSSPSRSDELISKLRGQKSGGMNPRLVELADKVRSVKFGYKPGKGQDTTDDNTGVIAQDLQKTDMADNVKETPQGLAVDIGKQTMSNTNYIADIARDLRDVRELLAALRGDK
jgi:hypothetical protein